MWLRPKPALTQTDVHNGLRMVIADGLAAEAMTTLTGGAFLTAMALLMGASNLLIGIISIRNSLKDYFLIGNMITLHEPLWGILRRIQQKRSEKKQAVSYDTACLLFV